MLVTMLNTDSSLSDTDRQCESSQLQSDSDKLSKVKCDRLDNEEKGTRKRDSPVSNSTSVKTEQRSPSPIPAPNLNMDVQFTNFFIDEILKPHFGKIDSITVQQCSPMVKSECGAFSRRFSGLIHKPIPTFKQIHPSSNRRPVVSSVQPTALDLRQEKGKIKTSQSEKSYSDNLFRKKQDSGFAELDLTKARLQSQHTSPVNISPVVNRLRSPPRTPSPASSVSSNCTSTGSTVGDEDKSGMLWPAWVYCTRYSDRPSSGPRSRRTRRKERAVDEKRPRTAFSTSQLERLKREFEQSRYLTEQKRQGLAQELNLNESQIKIWFQNKRAKLKKAGDGRNGLALHLMAQGLYNHATTTRSEVEEIDVES